ncbi:MAG TPA: c-type cytochrome [Thermoleophilaceae bacterium]|nr:c-type cytochrome [Thermoleophilaceae bacterium]
MRLVRHTKGPLLAAAVAAALVLLAGACGRDEADLSNGKAQFVQSCGSCHALDRAGTQGVQGPDLDAAFRAALRSGMDRDTVEGIVHRQIGSPRRNSVMPADLVKGDDARDVAAYVAYATDRAGQDEGALAQAGLAGATSGEQIFTAAGCAGCHQFTPAGSNGNIGPSLDDLASGAGEREPGTSAEEYVRQSLLEPDAFVVQGYSNVMPSFDGKLDDKQLQAVIDYLLKSGE